MDIVSKAQDFFFERIKKFGSDPYHLWGHVPLVIEQIKKCLKEELDADELVCLLWWRLHDIWHYPVPTDVDHAVRWATIAQEFLEDNRIDEDIITRVVHCVRSHRCKDVQPESLEAKIVAFSDSASHLMDSLYIEMIKDWRSREAWAKLERDWRDLWLLPKIQHNFTWLYDAWKHLLAEYEKMQ